jgi:hypothetical protein
VLDTADVIDPMVHGREHHGTSTGELPELNTTCAWAVAARLVRVTGGKLAAVQENAVLLDRPVPLWERMFATFGTLGPPTSGGGAMTGVSAPPSGALPRFGALRLRPDPDAVPLTTTRRTRGYPLRSPTSADRHVRDHGLKL